ncbi:type II secretion system protein [Oceanobacillus picturae]|uniref:type II secretion system protein n=1 Tax=Oceanobacillus picturae TaxID=171693 RepID=UPI00363C026F
MNFRQLNNEKGITLVELLASIGLLAIVIALSSTVFSQMFSAEEKAEGDIKIKQTLNVIVAEMKNGFINGEEKICVHEPDLDVSFHNFENIHIENVEGNCIEVIEPLTPVSFEITVTDENEQTSTVKTAWEKNLFH